MCSHATLPVKSRPIRQELYAHARKEFDGAKSGEPINCASSIRSKVSAFSQKVDLKVLLPEAEDCLSKWEKKQDPQTQAKTMDESEMIRLYNLPPTAANIPKQAFVGCQLAFAGRGIEGHKLLFTSVKPAHDEDQEVTNIAVKYIRKKTAGIPVVLETFITGTMEIRAVMLLYNAHTAKSKTGNFFAYVDEKTMKVKDIKNPNIGHNPLSECGKYIFSNVCHQYLPTNHQFLSPICKGVDYQSYLPQSYLPQYAIH